MDYKKFFNEDKIFNYKISFNKEQQQYIIKIIDILNYIKNLDIKLFIINEDNNIEKKLIEYKLEFDWHVMEFYRSKFDIINWNLTKKKFDILVGRIID